MRSMTLTGVRTAAMAVPLAALMATGAFAADLPPVIAPADLQATLEADTGVRVIDIRGGQTKAGTPVFAAGHIPGAVSAPYGEWRGPADNPGKVPDLAALTGLVQKLGITPETPVVVVHQGADATDFGSAARVAWTLKSLGVDDISILNGGLSGWQKAGLPLSQEAAPVTASDYAPTFDGTWTASHEDVLAQVEGDGPARLLDARPKGFFEGRLWHDAAHRPGTLPGAENFSHDAWFKKDSAELRDVEAIRALVAEHGLDDAKTTVSFCNTGHWAATNWFVLSEVAGVPDVKLHPQSMVGWSQAGLPMQNVPGRIEWLWMSTVKWFEGITG